MMDYDAMTDNSGGQSRRGEAYHEDGDDDEEGEGRPGFQRVQCANQ